jgi:hypothetical protein
MPRKKAFSVRIGDCETQTFRAGGSGGQNQNKRDTGVRIIHHPSGARGESREERSQLQNKRKAFARIASDPKFLAWCRTTALQIEPVDDIVDEMMKPGQLKVEVREGNRWVESNTLSS